MTTQQSEAPAVEGKTKQPSTGMSRSAKWARRAPLMPALIFVIVLTQIPFATTLVLSFTDWVAFRPDDRGFAGFDNYVDVFTDPTARSAVFVTIILTVTVVLVSLLLGLSIALLLDREFWGRGIVRTMMIAPFLVVPVAAALVWKHALYNPDYGLFNGLLRMVFGDNAPTRDWISQNPLIAIEVSLIWQWTPFMMLILLAGLQSRPMDVVEAARIDGANAWQIFTNMTLPHLRQYLELAGLLGAIYVVQTFDHVFTLTAGALGTSNLPFHIYQKLLVAQNYGEASAAGVVTVIGTIIIATFALKVAFSLFQEEHR
ncbi:MAG: carbohydrate ABC transporter permease [Ornithinimicrobium sp.]|jgi:sorbitol/mannitol transport system permease protein|uniref:carbohydrate ABC transporter permease n=1 Tax=Ornithinimicrobium sp. TaxID=1977084 RepID=UPI003D9BCD6D